VKREKESLKKLLSKAEHFIKTKNYKRAIEELEKETFKDVNYYLLLAQAYEGLGQSEKAEIFFEKARFLDTEIRSKELLRRGTTFASMKNFKAAEAQLLKAIELNPFHKEAYFHLFSLYKELGRKEKMLRVLTDILTLEPYAAFAYLEASKIYFSMKRYRLAISILKRGIERIGGNAELHFQLAQFYSELGKSELAKEELRKACEIDVKNVEYRQKLAEILVSDEEYEEALDVMLGALELFPESPYLLQSVAALYDILGDEELAEHYYRRAVSHSEGFMELDAKKMLAEFFVERGMFDQAEELLWELLETSDNIWISFDVFMELYFILAEQERFRDVIRAGKFLLENPELAEDEFVELGQIVAEALFEEGHFSEAKVLYEKILPFSSDRRSIKKINAKISQLKEIEELEKMLKKG